MAPTAPTPPKPGPRGMSGPERVAAILLTMGKPQAARLMKHFEPAEIKLITRSVAELKPVAAPTLEGVIEDFASLFASGAHLVGAASEVERMLNGVLPQDQIDEIMADILGNADRSVWERISTVGEAQLAAYIMKEHAQTAALILTKVKPSCAAKVLGHIPAERRNGIIRRMLAIKPVIDDTMRILERTLYTEFTMNFQRNSGGDSHAKLADIINKMERDHMDDVLTNLTNTRPKSAEMLKSLLFTFDDIIKLSPKARVSLFEQVPNDKTVLALKGTTAEFREVILSALSARVRRMVEQELNAGQQVAAKDVQAARRLITDLALEMAGRGEIEINAEEEEELVS